MATLLKHIVLEDGGAAGVEYGILVGAVAALMVVLLFAIGTGLQASFQTVCDSMTNYITMDSCQ